MKHQSTPAKPLALRAACTALACALAAGAAARPAQAAQLGMHHAAASSTAVASTAPARMLPTLPSLDDLPSPTLPSAAALAQTFAGAPALFEAQAMQRAAASSGEALRAGSNEFTTQAQLQQRRIDAFPDSGRYTEWQLLINRQLRLPAQAQADVRLAGALQTAAQATLAAARQRLAGELLDAWFAAQRAQAEAQLARHDQQLIEAQAAALERRLSAGDASQLELEQLRAEQARTRATLLLAQGQAASSRAALLARYPALGSLPVSDGGAKSHADEAATPRTGAGPAQTAARAGGIGTGTPAESGAGLTASHAAAEAALPQGPILPLEMPADDIDALRARALERNPLVVEQRAALQKAQAASAQARAARTPQPTVGAYIGSDRGGAERIVGLQLAVPFGGPARAAQERAALAEVEAAQWRLRDAQAQAVAGFARLHASVQAQLAALAASEASARAQAQASHRMWRAYQLGEAGLADWLLARRNALEATRLALQARFDAAAALAQLQLQTGLLDLPGR
jgi:outer membrane protein TolC